MGGIGILRLSRSLNDTLADPFGTETWKREASNLEATASSAWPAIRLTRRPCSPRHRGACSGGRVHSSNMPSGRRSISEVADCGRRMSWQQVRVCGWPRSARRVAASGRRPTVPPVRSRRSSCRCRVSCTTPGARHGSGWPSHRATRPRCSSWGRAHAVASQRRDANNGRLHAPTALRHQRQCARSVRLRPGGCRAPGQFGGRGCRRVDGARRRRVVCVAVRSPLPPQVAGLAAGSRGQPGQPGRRCHVHRVAACRRASAQVSSRSAPPYISGWPVTAASSRSSAGRRSSRSPLATPGSPCCSQVTWQCHPVNPAFVLAGTQDNGLQLRIGETVWVKNDPVGATVEEP